MPKIPATIYWQNVDIAETSQNWVLDINGVERRQGARASTGRMVCYAFNHLAARHARTIFHRAIPFNDGVMGYPTVANVVAPLYAFAHRDTSRNLSSYVVRVVAMPADNAVFNESALLEINIGAGYSTQLERQNVATDRDVNHYADALFYSGTVNRSEFLEDTAYISVDGYGGYRPLDILIQEVPLESLDTAQDHSMADPFRLRSTSKVLADSARNVADGFNELRATTQPHEFSWHAIGDPAGPNGWGTTMSGAGDKNGMRVAATDVGANLFVNFLDHGEVAWANNSPGMPCAVYRCGLGAETTERGQEVNVSCYALAATVADTSNAKIKFLTGSSEDELDCDGTSDAKWYGPAIVTLSSDVEDDDITDSANKIDFHGQCANGALYVYALEGFRTAP